MSYTKMQCAAAVMKAIREFDEIGRAGFLDKYGFGRAKEYFIELNGKLYDSKAILGAAYGYEFPQEGPLTSADFVGGENTVKPKLAELGFDVIHQHSVTVAPGRTLSNAQLAQAFHCGTQGGIRWTPLSRHKMVQN